MNLSPHDKQLLQHAQGYFELGMFEDAWTTIEQIDPDSPARTTPEILAFRLKILVAAKKWKEAAILGETVCKILPDDPSGFLHTACALHELKRTKEAKDVLLSGPRSLKDQAIFHFNLGCYEAQLGNIEEAKDLVQKAIEIDRSLQMDALDDPDLEPIWPLLKSSE